MSLMTTNRSVLSLPQAGPLTVDDLQDTPDDARRYELIDGILLVSPGVVALHQRVAARLFTLLADLCPPDLEVLGPFTLRLARNTEVIPDLAVIRPGPDPLPRYPRDILLAVEVLSPSTRRRDLTLKKQVYADAGIASYWVIDPDQPSLVVYELVESDYVQGAQVVGADTFDAVLPYPVSVAPSALVVRG